MTEPRPALDQPNVVGQVECPICGCEWRAKPGADAKECPLCVGLANDEQAAARKAMQCMMALLREAVAAVVADAPDIIPNGLEEPHPSFLRPALLQHVAEELQSEYAETHKLMAATLAVAVQAQLAPALCCLQEYTDWAVAEYGGNAE